MLTIAACLFGVTRPSLVYSAVLPAVFAGLATGSKYTLAVVLLPVLLAIGFEFNGRPQDLELARGHRRDDGDVPRSRALQPDRHPRFSEWRRLRGVPLRLRTSRIRATSRDCRSCCSICGISRRNSVWRQRSRASAWRSHAAANWRRAVILAIFPSRCCGCWPSQRVHFPRNVLSLHPFIAMFAAFGLVSLFTWVLGMASHRGWKVGTAMRVSIAAILLIAVVPVWRVAGHVRDRIDSRNVAAGLPRAAGLAGVDDRRAEAARLRCSRPSRSWTAVSWWSISSRRATKAALQALLRDVPAPAVILVPRWGADRRFSEAGTRGHAERSRPPLARHPQLWHERRPGQLLLLDPVGRPGLRRCDAEMKLPRTAAPWTFVTPATGRIRTERAVLLPVLQDVRNPDRREG